MCVVDVFYSFSDKWCPENSDFGWRLQWGQEFQWIGERRWEKKPRFRFFAGWWFQIFFIYFQPYRSHFGSRQKNDRSRSSAFPGSLRNFARRKMITFTEADGSDVTPAVRTQATDLFNGGDDPRPVLDQVIANRPEVVVKDKVRVHAPLLICEGAEEDVEVDQLKSANPLCGTRPTAKFSFANRTRLATVPRLRKIEPWVRHTTCLHDFSRVHHFIWSSFAAKGWKLDKLTTHPWCLRVTRHIRTNNVSFFLHCLQHYKTVATEKTLM